MKTMLAAIFGAVAMYARHHDHFLFKAAITVILICALLEEATDALVKYVEAKNRSW